MKSAPRRARKLIELNKAGECNPEALCEQALKAIRQPPFDEVIE